MKSKLETPSKLQQHALLDFIQKWDLSSFFPYLLTATWIRLLTVMSCNPQMQQMGGKTTKRSIKLNVEVFNVKGRLLDNNFGSSIPNAWVEVPLLLHKGIIYISMNSHQESTHLLSMMTSDTSAFLVSFSHYFSPGFCNERKRDNYK